MPQTTVSVPLEVKPESRERLVALIEALREAEAGASRGAPADYARLARALRTLHFMSISVFPAHDLDPLLILEFNFDGPERAFWPALDAALGEPLRAMVRCCKRPLNEDGSAYDAVTAEPPTAPVARYLAARRQRPSVFFHGNRGLDRTRIEQEAALFLAIRDRLKAANPGGPSPYRGLAPGAAHARLRAALLPDFPWLAQAAPRRISRRERIADWARLLLFASVTLAALAAPGILAAALLPTKAYLLACLLVAAVIAALVMRVRKALPGTGTAGGFNILAFIARQPLMVAAVVAAYALLVVPVAIVLALAGSAIVAAIMGTPAPTLAALWRPVAATVALGAIGAALAFAALVARVRYLERRDSSHDAPVVDEATVREIARREDWIAQNHMGSIVTIKPGVLRSIVIHAGHLGLGLVLRVKATEGYLGSMRTVHFAHWAFLNNHSRLLFFSNFDHSWDSYLDDFIEKAHEGLTLAWGCGIGFPPTRFLLWDGASHGRQFKAWALASRAVSRFWFSAYKELTVDQIERNHRIATGLRRARLDDRPAAAWMRDL